MKKRLFILSHLALILIFLSGCSHALLSLKPPKTSLTPEPTSEVKDHSEETVTVNPTPSPTITPRISPTPGITATVTPSITPAPITEGEEDLAYAQELIQGMSLEEKIGQLFIVRCRGSQAVQDIKDYHLGGYILFADDFKNKTKEQVINTVKQYQNTAEIPMLIGVDEEGGTVNRISKFPAFRETPFASPQDLYQKGGYDLIISDTIEKSKLLKALGININLAPVCDVSTDSKDFIYQRSFGKNAEETSKYVRTVVSTMNSEDMGSVLKHFPGYGNNVDTHTGISIDNRSYQSFETKDFLPFIAGIEAGAGCILVSHNIVTAMDEDYPASLSPAVHSILRDELGFQGVIMTDDLSMDAIKQYTNDQNAAILAINAGNDLLIATDFDVQIPVVIEAVKDHTIAESTIDKAVTRVLLWKLSLGIIDRP